MEVLQTIWFLLIGVLLIGYAILDGFDLGVGFWHLFARKRVERSAFIESIEPFWDGNEVWLLTGGGALFAAFPPVYATVFSGFYFALILVLVGLIFRAVAIEFRNKVDAPRWIAAWDLAFSIGSILPSILFGVAIGNVLSGLELNESGDYTGGFFALLNPFSLLCGIVGLSMFAFHGALYLGMKIEGELLPKIRRWVRSSGLVFLLLYFLAGIWGIRNYLYGVPAVPIAFFLLALFCGLLALFFSGQEKDGYAFAASCLTIEMVMLSVAFALFPNLVPCTNEPGWSLTVYNSSSSLLTLKSMLVIALIGMPVVLGYTYFIHRVFKGRVKVRG